MAAVTVHTGPISATDFARNIPPDKWFNLMLARRTKIHISIPHDCRSLIDFVAEAEEYRMWEQTGHADLDDYIRNGLEVDPELLNWARIGLSAFEDGEPVSLDKAVEMGRMIASIEPAKKQGGTGANQYTVDPESKVANDHSAKKGSKTSQKSSASPTRIIARLKRDAATNQQAQALLDTLEAGDISARQAALQMGYIKPADPARIVEKQREKMEPAEQVALWREWGRSLPDDAIDRLAVAQEAFMNLYETEQHRFLTWARKSMKESAA